jgi:hypothetical protein
VLEPGQRGKCYLTDCQIEIIGWDTDQLVSPAVESDCTGVPEAANHDFLGIIGGVGYDAIQGQSATKTNHRTNSYPPSWHTGDPAGSDPETDCRNERRGDRQCNQGPISQPDQRGADASPKSRNKVKTPVKAVTIPTNPKSLAFRSLAGTIREPSRTRKLVP